MYRMYSVSAVSLYCIQQMYTCIALSLYRVSDRQAATDRQRRAGGNRVRVTTVKARCRQKSR